MIEDESKSSLEQRLDRIHDFLERLSRVVNRKAHKDRLRSRLDVEQKRGQDWGTGTSSQTVRDERPQYHRRMERGRNGSPLDRRGQRE